MTGVLLMMLVVMLSLAFGMLAAAEAPLVVLGLGLGVPVLILGGLFGLAAWLEDAEERIITWRDRRFALLVVVLWIPVAVFALLTVGCVSAPLLLGSATVGTTHRVPSAMLPANPPR